MFFALLLACQQAPAVPGLVVVTIDTWRADHLSAARSPNTWALAQQGLNFTNAWTSIGLTTAAHATLFTGRLPTSHGLRGNNHHGYRLGPEIPTLAEQLRRAGWDTAAFASSWPALGDSGLHRGFEVAQGPDSGERDSQIALDAARDWLKDRDKPYLLWVHLNDPHGPYSPSSQDLAAVGGGDDDRARYAGEVHQADRLLKPLLDEAMQRKAWILLTADHGEVHEEERCGWQHERSSSPVVLRVPLVLLGPGIEAAQNEQAMAGLTDVFPTLLALAGLPDPGGHQGMDLRALHSGEKERVLWVAESGLCDPECSAGCAPAGFMGKDLVVYGRDGGVYVSRPGMPAWGDPSLAEALEGYSRPSEEPKGNAEEQARALGYIP